MTAAGGAPATGVHVALLRGVNVGGRTLAMAHVRAICTGLGYEDVATYIQSGNVVLRTGAARGGAIAKELAEAIRDQAEMDVTVIVRDAGALRAVLAANPFADRVDDGRLYVTFLAGPQTGSRFRPMRGFRTNSCPGTGSCTCGARAATGARSSTTSSSSAVSACRRRRGIGAPSRVWHRWPPRQVRADRARRRDGLTAVGDPGGPLPPGASRRPTRGD